MRTQQEGGCLRPKESGNQPCWHRELGLPVSKTMRKSMSVVQDSQPVEFCSGSRSRLVRRRSSLPTLTPQATTVMCFVCNFLVCTHFEKRVVYRVCLNKWLYIYIYEHVLLTFSSSFCFLKTFLGTPWGLSQLSG